MGKSVSTSGDEAFFGTAGGGMRSLRNSLTADFGLDLTGWQLRTATGISDDGLTLVGSGINPGGFQEAFIVTLPEPGTLAVVGIGASLILRRRGSGQVVKADPR